MILSAFFHTTPLITHIYNPYVLHRFRLLVVGKVRSAALIPASTSIDLSFLSYKQCRSGKSSLIKAIFKVDMPVRFIRVLFLRRRRDSRRKQG